MLRRAARLFVLTVVVLAVMEIALVAWHFPWDADDPVRREDARRSSTISPIPEKAGQRSVKDNASTRAAQEARTTSNILWRISEFVRVHHLEKARVLDVGSGSGYLQDAVEDYTGIDISRSVASHYHKRFVAGTATAMPFKDHEFDAAWSIWVLEHIPESRGGTLGNPSSGEARRGDLHAARVGVHPVGRTGP